MIRPLFQFATINGDGTGEANGNGDYSSEPGILYIQPQAEEVYGIWRLIIQIWDERNFNADNYGSMSGPLINGVRLQMVDDSGPFADLIGGAAVKANAHWGQVCYDVVPVSYGTGDDFLTVRWDFSLSGRPLILKGDANERIEITLQDDLTALNGHTFMFQGLKAPMFPRNEWEGAFRGKV